MITVTAAKKGTGLDDLFKGYTPQQLEEHKTVTSLCNPALQQLKQEFQKWLMDGNLYPKEVTRIALSPADIDLFLQATVEYEQYPLYRNFTSCFIDQLIGNSFRHGHRHFSLKTKNILPLNYLGSHLIDPQDQLLIYDPPQADLTIDGDVGHDFGYNGNSMHYLVRGNTGRIPFQGLKDSTAIVTGKINQPGFHAFWGASHSTFFLHEYDGGIPKSTRNCIFKTDDEKTYRNMKKRDSGENNHIYLVDKDNREVILAQ